MAGGAHSREPRPFGWDIVKQHPGMASWQTATRCQGSALMSLNRLQPWASRYDAAPVAGTTQTQIFELVLVDGVWKQQVKK